MSNKLLTTNFKLNNIRQFIESITEPANTIYYVFAGRPSPYSFGDIIEQPNESVKEISNDVYDQMVFAKQVTGSDVKPLINRYNWTGNTVFAMYDDENLSLASENFYTVTEEGGTYYVFKCLYNNEGLPSLVQPLFSQTSAEDEYYETSDGYQWKYMYSIDNATFNKFSTVDFIPVIPDSNTSSNAISGAIDVIKIDSGGKNYNNYLSGYFNSSDIKVEGNTLKYRISTPSFQQTIHVNGVTSEYSIGDEIFQSNVTSGEWANGYITSITKDSTSALANATLFISNTNGIFKTGYDVKARTSSANGVSDAVRVIENAPSTQTQYYKDCIIKIVNGTGKGQYRKITSYEVSGGKFVYIDTPFTTDLSSDSEYEITPEVIIKGKGNETVNAAARALVNSTASNSIYKVEILNRGEGYFYATATVSTNSAVRVSNSTNDAALRVIMPPKNGHGYDAESELYASRMGISVKFSNTESGTIPTDNDFRTIGLLKDPKFSNVQINYTDKKGPGFQDTETVFQYSLARLGGSVSVSNTSKNVFGLGTLTGFIVYSPGQISYANTDVLTVTNVAINAIASMTTDASGNLASLSVVSKGFGFSDTQSPLMIVANSSGGNTRHVNSKIVTAYTISANGKGYSNSDVITVTTTGDHINAIASLTTDADGGITDILITNSGRNFASNEIAFVKIIDPGSGYDSTTNNQITFVGGDGGGAIATFTNNYSGQITTVDIINPGTGYLTAPTVNTAVEPSGCSASIAVFDAVLVANSITVNISNSSGGATTGARVGGTAQYSVDYDDVLEFITVTSGGEGIYSNDDIIVFQSELPNGNASANIKTDNSGSINIAFIDKTSNNFGFRIGTQPVTIVANTTGGNIRHFNGNIVSSITVSNSSPSFKVSEVSRTADGTGYNNTKLLRIDINDGGIGYNSLANNSLVITGGGGTGANATFTNNSLGKIISIAFANTGNAYTSVPTVTVAEGANGVGANLTAVLANSITFTSTVGGYGAVAYFTNTATGNISAITVSNGGFGYTTAPTATIQDSEPAGSGAILTVTINGAANVFANSDLITVTNGTINAVGNVVGNSTQFMTGVQMVNSGKDFNVSTLDFFVANSTSGDIRRLNNTYVESIAVTTAGSMVLSNSDVVYVVGGSKTGISNLTTNTIGGLTTLTVTDGGSGFANHSTAIIYAANTSNGNIRFFNSNVVYTLTVNDGGIGYSNNDKIIVSNTTGINAQATILTDANGQITDVALTNGGRGFTPSYVSNITVTASGTGYSNTDFLKFYGGGGSGANGKILTHANGTISQVYVTNGGINYSCAPSVEVANSTGGTSSGSGANLIATIIKPSALRIVKSDGTPSNGSFADIDFTIIASPTVQANLVYAPVVNVGVVQAAELEIDIVDSANLQFTTRDAANIGIVLTGELTSFDSQVGAGDYVYIETSDGQVDVLQVNSVTNSTHLTLKDFPLFTANAVAISLADVQAQGIVLNQSTNIVYITNGVGFFENGSVVFGTTTKTSGNVTNISLGGITKNFTTLNQLQKYYGTASGTFEEDEIVYVQTPTGNSTARFHSGNSSVMYVTEQRGLFLASNTVIGNTSGAQFVLSSGSSYKYDGDIIKGSGDVMYIENIEAISRSNTQSETIKLIVEF